MPDNSTILETPGGDYEVVEEGLQTFLYTEDGDEHVKLPGLNLSENLLVAVVEAMRRSELVAEACGRSDGRFSLQRDLRQLLGAASVEDVDELGHEAGLR